MGNDGAAQIGEFIPHGNVEPSLVSCRSVLKYGYPPMKESRRRGQSGEEADGDVLEEKFLDIEEGGKAK